MSFLAEQTGYTRQWISKAAAAGKVPGAFRRPSGRWSFPHSQALEEWIDQHRSQSGNWIMRHVTREEHMIETLRERREKAWNRFGTPNGALKHQMNKLAQAIHVAEANLKDYLTCAEIAVETRRTKRWVQQMADRIPGVVVRKNRYEFRKSAKLALWIDRERRASRAEIRKQRRQISVRSSRHYSLFMQTGRYRNLADAILRQQPLELWPPLLRESMLTELADLCELLTGHLQEWSAKK